MRKMKKYLLVVGAAMLAALSVTAESVDKEQAQMAVARFLSTHAPRSIQASVRPLQVDYVKPSAIKADAADYYVLNADDGSAFYIVSGDDRAREVLAWGDHALDMNNVPCNLQWLLDHYAEEIEWLHAHPDASVERPSLDATLRVDPLLVCTWSQGTPYNDQCPVYKGEHCVTGCIATAMAQVMYYWKFPDELPPLPAYVAHAYNIVVPALPGTQLDWDNMLDGYTLEYNDEHAEAVSTLMRYCGQGASMEYGTNGSGSGCWNQMVGMQVFGYNLSASIVHRRDYSNEEWEAFLHEDLSKGYPVLYSGYGDAGGHAFVVDGCIGSYYHVNWGWEGGGNDYYSIDAFVVSGMSFQSNQEMIHDLYPFVYGTDVRPYDFETGGVCYKIKGNEVAVVNREERYGSYSGSVVVPETVSYNGVNYPVTEVANGAFRESAALTSVMLPKSIKRIGKYAFKNCKALTVVNIPEGVTSIDYCAFEACTNLKTVSFGANLESIGYYAFYGCRNLTRVVIPASVKTIECGAFASCRNLKSVIVGNGTEIIGPIAFYGCYALKEVTIGDGLLTLGEAAFYGCYNLETVKMGLSVETIEPFAFSGCYALSRLVVMPEVPPTVEDRNAFEEYHFTKTKLVVTREARDNYICDFVWTDFENIVCLEDEIVPGDVNGDGEINIADVNALIDQILSGASSPEGDVNGDGKVNIADINAVIDMILNGD